MTRAVPIAAVGKPAIALNASLRFIILSLLEPSNFRAAAKVEVKNQRIVKLRRHSIVWNPQSVALSPDRVPDGSVAYTHEVSTTGTLEEIIGAPPPSPVEVDQALLLKRKREQEKANRIASQREADLSAAVAEIRDATMALETAKQTLKSGLEPGPGERLGTTGAYTRFSPAYWQRVRGLQLVVDDARERLDDPYSARNAVK